MKRSFSISVLAITWSALCQISSAQEVLYYEPFSQGIPNDFRIVDVDSLRVHPSLDSTSIETFPFDGSWVTQISFSNSEDTVAASSSRYSTPGRSDDWLITPQIAIPDSGVYLLQWRAASLGLNLRDGYEVYVSTTGDQVEDFTQSIFSINQERPTWITRKVSLADFAGQNVYVAFRNNSDDKFILFLDDVYIADSGGVVNADPAIFDSEFPTLYTRAPLGQMDTFFFAATVGNLGNSPILDTLRMTASIFSPFPDNPIYSQTLTGPTPPIDTSSVGVFEEPSNFAPVDTGIHIVAFTLSSNQQDSLPVNGFTREVFDNDIDLRVIDVSDSTLARDDGRFTSIWDEPVSEGNQTILGSVFHLIRSDVLTSATAFIFPFAENVGDEIVAQVYNSSFELLGQSESYTVLHEDSTGEGVQIDLSFVPDSSSGTTGIPLSSGPFLLALKGAEFLPVLMSDNIFIEGATVFTWDSIAQNGLWFTTEDIKPLIDSVRALSSEGRGPFNDRRVLGLRANLAGCGGLNAELEIVNDDGSTNGRVAVIPSGGVPPYSYTWSDIQPRPETDSVLSGLSEGRYSVVVADSRGCETFLLAVIATATSRKDPSEIGMNVFSVYPNPVSATLSVDCSLKKPNDVYLSLLDIQGSVLYTKVFRQTLALEHRIPTHHWASGVYLLRVQTSQGILTYPLLVK
ncbi:MAG: choice-of-anchor J domain-containing protein [Bacteroidota bacterium]